MKPLIEHAKKHCQISLWALVAVFVLSGAALAQTTAFNYQGRLTDMGNPANGNYQLEFRVFDAVTDGAQIGATISNVAVTAAQGVFTTQLDFGANVFTGADRFLEIAVKRIPGDPFTILTPRQKITSSPYSITSANALNLGGLAANTYLQTNGDGAALTNLNAGQIASGTVNDARLSPNVATLDANNVFTGSDNTFPRITLSGDGEIIAPRLENLPTEAAPASAANAGRVYFNTTTNSVMVSNGSAWIDLSPASRQIQTFSGVTASTTFNNCKTTTPTIRTATFTKSSAASRLRITVKDTEFAFGGSSFILYVSVGIDGVLVGNPTALRMAFNSTDIGGLFQAYGSFTAVGYADGVAAGTHSLTTIYSISSQGVSFTCVRDTEPYLIEVEEIP